MFGHCMNDLGHWFHYLKRFDLAEECYKKSYKKNFCVALYNLGSMYVDRYGRYLKEKNKRNIANIIEGQEPEKDDIEENNQLAKLKKAEKLLLRYITVTSDDADGYYYLSLVYEYLTDYDKSKEYRIMAFKYGEFCLINRIMAFSRSYNSHLAEFAYEMFIKLFKHNEYKYYLNQNGSLSVNKPHNEMGDIENEGWTERTLSDSQIKQIDGKVVNALGMMYLLKDMGMHDRKKKAHRLFKIASQKGCVSAHYNLAMDFIKGDGIKHSWSQNRDKYLKKGLELLEKGEALNEASCIRELGRIYDIVPNHPYNYFSNIVEKNAEKSLQYFKDAADKKDGFSCHYMVKHLQKTEGRSFGSSDKLYYDSNISKKQMLYLFQYMTEYGGYDEPKNVEVPFNVLEHMKHLITYKMKKLKKKIMELELRPPEEGGRLYLEACDSFRDNISSFNI